jgi:hypothetical protein
MASTAADIFVALCDWGVAGDPCESPMPPKAILDQAAKCVQSLTKGQPHRGRIALTVLSDKVGEFI